MKRRSLNQLLAATLLGASAWVALPVQAADEAPDALIERLTGEALGSIKADKAMQSGDVARIVAMVDKLVMPNLDFKRMTASAVGPKWRQATPEQQARLQDEFKTLLVRTYAGALTQVNDLTVRVKPMRSSPQDSDVVVRTEIKGRGDPIQLDYRMEKTPGVGAGWKIYNLNVLGVWLVDTYRSQFAQEINAKGIDGLITTLAERNKSNAAKG
jgi:phospholipid transport system substrate-binding protein